MDGNGGLKTLTDGLPLETGTFEVDGFVAAAETCWSCCIADMKLLGDLDVDGFADWLDFCKLEGFGYFGMLEDDFGCGDGGGGAVARGVTDRLGRSLSACKEGNVL